MVGVLRSRGMDKVGAVAIYHLGSIVIVVVTNIIGGSCCR